jgi:hypothetical protein
MGSLSRSAVVSAALITLLVAALLLSGCASKREQFVGTWRCVGKKSGPLGYTFGADGRYVEYYKDGAKAATLTVEGDWGFSTGSVEPAVVLHTVRKGLCSEANSGVLTYRFSGNELYMGRDRLVRVSQDSLRAAN